VQELEVAYINGVFYARIGGDMHQPKLNASVEVKNTNGTSGGERIKGRYDVTIGRASIVEIYEM
jgi:hypothetical protein